MTIKMKRFFNTTGPCNPEEHYTVDSLKRLTGILELIEKKLYFILHAPRQTGKTTYLFAMEKELNKTKDYVALAFSIESVGYKGIDVDKGFKTIIRSIYEASKQKLPQNLLPLNPDEFTIQEESLKVYLSRWSETLYSQGKKLILFIDEADCIRNDDFFIAFLRQLRSGYTMRPEHFPSSIGLVGLRDIRDYKIKLRPDQESLGTASPFNVKAESLFMDVFSKDETFYLLSEHEKDTGQIFPEEVKAYIYDQTNGQPWLVNAFANQIVFKILKEDLNKPITLATANQARYELIQRRDTHLDCLIDKLQEERVRKIVEAVIIGNPLPEDVLNDDLSYVFDLGLIVRKKNGPIEFANKIYGEIIPRVINTNWQYSINNDYVSTPWYIKSDGSLDMDALLKKFQEFYRRHSESWLERYEYKEAGHQLLLMAFLQRIINSGGDIEREMAVGNGRIDLLVKYGKNQFALELKKYRDTYTKPDGLDQVTRYLDKLGLDSGYLVIFETRKDISWEERIAWQEIEYKNKKITLVGL